MKSFLTTVRFSQRPIVLKAFTSPVSRGLSTSNILRTAPDEAIHEKIPHNTKAHSASNDDPLSIEKLDSMGIVDPTIIGALKKLGFSNLTGVQTKTVVPMLTTDHDIVAKAKTGTGKTLAFGIPLMQQIISQAKGHPGVRSLVIAPTRDLAFQIRDEFEKISNDRGVKSASSNRLTVRTIVGGESRFTQIKNFTSRRNQAPTVVVATPGRFMDLIKEPDVANAFANLQTLVLDEADRLLGEGFKEDLVEITDILKELREESNLTDLKPLRTMLFSATLDKEIIKFSKRILNDNAQHIDTVDPNEPETHEKISQSLILTDDIFQSYASAAMFIHNESTKNRHFKAIVFLPTVKAVSFFYELLNNYLREQNFRLHTHQLHGQLRQNVRDRAVKNFRNGFAGVLVASDVGARGMDFPKVTNVIQVGLPMDATNYVHRVGRTARGGSTGEAVMIMSKAESRFIDVLKKRNLEVKSQFEYEQIPETEAIIADIYKRVPHKFTLTQVLESMAGFSKGVGNSYGLRMNEILSDLSSAYGKFEGDESLKPEITQTFASKVLGLSRREAEKYFEIKQSGYDPKFEGNGRSGSRSNNSRGGYNNNRSYSDRGNNSSYSKNDDGYRNNRSSYGDRNNSRGGYGDRNNSKGGYDRNNSKGGFNNNRNNNGGNREQNYNGKRDQKKFRFD